MKAGLYTCASLAALLQLTAAAAVPQHRQHKRALETAMVYEDIQVYVHEDGTPFSTAINVVTDKADTSPAPAPAPTSEPAAPPPAQPTPAPTITAAAAAAAPPASNPPAASPNTPEPKPSSAQAPAPPKSTPVAASPKPSPTQSNPQGGNSGSGPGFKSGIAYSPYKAGGGCRTADQVKQDVSKLSSYSVIRTYGTDCNQVANVIVAKGSNQQVFAGIFDVNNAQQEAQQLADQVNGNWGAINTVNVGNEQVNNGQASVDQVTGAIASVRSFLRGKGYQGPVVTVDTAVAMKANIGLCKASDYCAINCHAFFDGNVLPADAGKFVQGWVGQIQDLSGGKDVVVTESGWPNSGSANGKAIPSMANQQSALSSLKNAFDNNLILYSAFDNKWMKDSAKTFNAEKHWGILGNAPSDA